MHGVNSRGGIGEARRQTAAHAPLLNASCSTSPSDDENDVRGHPYMTSALRGGGGVRPKEDVVREVA